MSNENWFTAKMRVLSMGAKLVFVCGLTLIMAIPAFFVDSMVDERARRAEGVAKGVSEQHGGEGRFLGPTLVLPYKTDDTSGTILVAPETGSGNVTLKTQELRRSLYKVAVFDAHLSFDSAFDLRGIQAELPGDAVVDWSRAEFVVGVGDTRGALDDGTISINGLPQHLHISQTSPKLALGSDDQKHLSLIGLGVSANGEAKPDAQIHVTSELHFSGAKRLALLPFARTTRVTMEGDWKNPGFDGGFSPESREVNNGAFKALWSVPSMAREIPAVGKPFQMGSLLNDEMGVSFVEVANPYQSVTRSLKYVLLFLGMVFLSYFAFEATTGKRVHPAQYGLVGVAQIIFYLLLLSLAERVGFDWAFLVAGGATVSLLAVNAQWVFDSNRQGVRALGVFSLLYGLIYALLRMEDNALLVGSAASFAIVAAAMYLTRKVDWYGRGPAKTGYAAAGVRDAARFLD